MRWRSAAPVSTSSSSTIVGACAAASGIVCWKSLVTSFWLLPADQLPSACGSIWRKRTLARAKAVATSLARPRASVVLPCPAAPIGREGRELA